MEPLFAFTGVVGHGRAVGRALGFPTANLSLPDGAPANGVYAALVDALDKKGLPAVLNQGVRPTFNVGEANVEVHILEKCPDLYGQTITVKYVKFLRGERAFDSPEELSRQIEADAREAMRVTCG